MTSRVYVFAQFKPKEGKEAELFEVLQALEPDAYREEGCIQYMLTRQITHPSAMNSEFTIAFNEIWKDAQAWSAHGRRKQIKDFFANQVEAETGLVEDVMVTAYTDEGHNYDKPIFE